MRLGKPTLLLNNHSFHHMLVNGIEVDYKAKDGRMVSGRVYMVDFENIENNDWLFVNQYTVEASHQNGKVNRRPDVVIFVNGLPLAVIELKNATDENATIWSVLISCRPTSRTFLPYFIPTNCSSFQMA